MGSSGEVEIKEKDQATAKITFQEQNNYGIEITLFYFFILQTDLFGDGGWDHIVLLRDKIREPTTKKFFLPMD